MRFRKVYRSYGSIVLMVVFCGSYCYWIGKSLMVLLFFLGASIIWVYFCSYYIIIDEDGITFKNVILPIAYTYRYEEIVRIHFCETQNHRFRFPYFQVCSSIEPPRRILLDGVGLSSFAEIIAVLKERKVEIDVDNDARNSYL